MDEHEQESQQTTAGDLTLVQAVEESLRDHGTPTALQALAFDLASRMDHTSDPDVAERLARRLLDVLRELGWTPAGRADDTSAAERFGLEAFTDLGGATLRNVAE